MVYWTVLYPIRVQQAWTQLITLRLMFGPLMCLHRMLVGGLPTSSVNMAVIRLPLVHRMVVSLADASFVIGLPLI